MHFLSGNLLCLDEGLKTAHELSHFSAILSSIIHAITDPKERENKTRI